MTRATRTGSCSQTIRHPRPCPSIPSPIAGHRDPPARPAQTTRRPGARVLPVLFVLAGLIAGLGLTASPGTTPGPAVARASDAASAAPAAEPADDAQVRADLKTLGDEAWALRSRLLPTGAADPAEAARLVRAAQTAAGKGEAWEAIHAFERALHLGHRAADQWLTLAAYYDRAQGPEPDAVRAAYLHAAEATTAGARAEGLLRAADLLLAAERDPLALALYRRAQAALPSDHARNGIAALTGDSLALRRVQVEADRDIPRVCLTLTAAPDLHPTDAPAIQPGDYVAVAPPAEVVVTVTDTRLCVDGLPHGTDATLTIRAGLPSVAGGRLQTPVTTAVRVPNRAPRLAFSSDAYILPARGVQEIALRSVNIDRARLSLYRVNDRGLPAVLRQRSLGDDVSRGDLEDLADNAGEWVWSGSLEIDSRPNQEVATAIPLRQILAAPQPGLYLLAAEDPLHDSAPWWDQPVQWLLVTDIGLQAATGLDGLSVFARSLSTGRPMTGANLTLVARNNDELAQAITDHNGLARFPAGLLEETGGRRASWIMARGPDGDFAYLDITGPAFDLTDRGVGGRLPPGAIDAFLYTDRGIYRPGETVHLVGLLRDAGAQALSGLPLTLKVLRPDGVEVDRQVLRETGAGGYAVDLPLLSDARMGRWEVTAHVDPAADPIGRVAFLVEDFVPQTMEITLAPDAPVLDFTAAPPPGDSGAGDGAEVADLGVSVTADYLYGAPAADLPVSGTLTLTSDPAPFPGYTDFHFGLVQEDLTPRRIDLPETRTQSDGRGRLELAVAEAVPDTSHPLRALIEARVTDAGGRGASRTLVLPVRHQPISVGIRPTFADDVVAEGSRVLFDLVALGSDGHPTANRTLDWVLYEEVSHYTWFESGGSWSYRRSVTDEPRASGRATTGADGLATVFADVAWGAFRLEVSDADGSLAASSTRFRAGWWVSDIEASDTPDTLKVQYEDGPLRPGGMARLRLEAPFAGQALVQVVTDRVLEVINIPVPREGLTVELPVTEAWGVGAYVVATAFRPGDGAGPRGPERAMGVAWVPVDRSDHELTVALEVPERIRPRSTWGVPVTVTTATGAPAAGPVWVSVAAVDEGILALTDFQSPDPVAHFHGKRALGLEYRDAYGRLLRAPDARPGRLREGGDASGRRLQGLPESSVRTVALFSGLVRVGADGRAVVPLTVPDFNGRLRLMAVAFSQEAIGQAETPVVVRDPLVALPSLPRFLAPGDRATFTLLLDNQDGPVGDWRVRLVGDGAVGVEAAPPTLSLDRGSRAVWRATLIGQRAGPGRLRLTLDGPDGSQRTSVFSLAVRSAAPPMTVAHAMDLRPNDRLVLTPLLLKEVVPETAAVSLSLSTLPNLNPLGNARALVRYPYACLEQTASRLIATLYSGALAAPSANPPGDPAGGGADRIEGGADGTAGPGGADAPTRDQLARDIQRLVALQRADGAFALWDSRGPAEPWLSAYALDVLLRARDAREPVPAFALDRGLAYLTQMVESGSVRDEILPAAAYAHYVLARAGRNDLGRLRYFHDVHRESLPPGLARIQTAAALAMMGDQSRARDLMRDGLVVPGVAPGAIPGLVAYGGPGEATTATRTDYGSVLRDQAAALALGLETGLIDAEALDAAEALARVTTGPGSRYLSTQERAWLVLAAHALVRLQGTLVATVDGTLVESGQVSTGLLLSPARLARGIDVTNDGNRPLRLVVTIDGQPVDLPPAESRGLVVDRQYRDLNGRPIALSEVRQNDLIVAVITGKVVAPEALSPAPTGPGGRDAPAADAADDGAAQVLVVDLLPAGLEIESPAIARFSSGFAMGTEGLDWLPEELRADHVEARDDRLVAALSLDPQRPDFTLAYVLRAVTPGSYVVPGVVAEAMYQPALRANQSPTRLTVLPARP